MKTILIIIGLFISMFAYSQNNCDLYIEYVQECKKDTVWASEFFIDIIENWGKITQFKNKYDIIKIEYPTSNSMYVIYNKNIPTADGFFRWLEKQIENDKRNSIQIKSE